ncbi:MAG: 2-C-methyl-D-erythritol 4-phosphate cytidylyltransferase [Clostridiales bacterium]|jgi:2-C-methyl-D-erythritol 4-phosphate cytidylyltransferase|nr:2-C-methyl-D-erythritol 4-phosphate cytidylyltransferase [Clostridiales bacterium]
MFNFKQKNVVMPKDSTVSVVIVAAGSGERLAAEAGAENGKALLQVAGKPLIQHSLEIFAQVDRVKDIIVVAREIDILAIYDIVNNEQIPKVRNIVPGGSTRQHSVYNGLKEVSTDYVLIHDAARPCITLDDINDLITRLVENGRPVTLASKIIDTINRVQNGTIVDTLDRDELFVVQTPQGFNTTKLKHAHEKAIDDGFESTDDAGLLENFGEKVHIVRGSSQNIKITYPDDVLVAEAILAARENVYGVF